MDQVFHKAFFIHGGPGLNSNPELNLLNPILKKNEIDCDFWNEPSALRGDDFDISNAFSCWEDSYLERINRISEKFTLIGSSFGALAILLNLDKLPKTVKRIILISPTFFLNDVFNKMIDFSVADYKKLNDVQNADDLNSLQQKTIFFYDNEMQDALKLVYANPNLFLHYWKELSLLQQWASYLSSPNFGMDLASQHAVLLQLSKMNYIDKLNSNRASNIPVSVCIGKYDPVNLEDENKALLRKKFLNIDYFYFKDSSHFPHIEEMSKFVEILNS